ncbi:phosphatidate cytidylyltransferase, mitochondrial isoform X1 [Drosophila willistoni]|uniref:phosphatidate cytidylyltransferase, mitochondrial isoform X1 n=1 Tax=Drosophila willistoni TaxID=7260 RepID=UPI000C26D35B|nr:phosphatidate cytidylyltransferase, mitochondrial isoform X1 [Drosophila willistoni]
MFLLCLQSACPSLTSHPQALFNTCSIATASIKGGSLLNPKSQRSSCESGCGGPRLGRRSNNSGSRRIRGSAGVFRLLFDHSINISGHRRVEKKRTVTRFPLGSVSYIFAYGSGVKQQLGYKNVQQPAAKPSSSKSSSSNVIDLVFCVRDALGFHAENMHRHPSHYSALRHLGPRFAAQYQERMGAGVYFNTLVPLEDLGLTIKYGVVSEEHLIEDLLHWRHLYLAGRLQKPVTDLVNPADNPRLKSALDRNLLSAFHSALLLLPEKFTAFELFHTIASLSYKGDFRMIFGENKQKVHNIVTPQINEFFSLYQPVMSKLDKYVAVDMHGQEPGSRRPAILFEQDKSAMATSYHLRSLPRELRRRLQRNAACRGDYADVVEHLSMAPLLPKVLQVSVNDIVWRSSVTQSLKNIATAGVFKSIVYSYRKAMKTFAN